MRRTTLVMRVPRPAVLGLVAVGTTVFLAKNVLAGRYQARQGQKASRELNKRQSRKWVPYIMGLAVVSTAAVFFAMYVLTQGYHARPAQEDSREFTDGQLRTGSLQGHGPNRPQPRGGEAMEGRSDPRRSLGAAEDVHREVTDYLRSRALERAREATATPP